MSKRIVIRLLPTLILATVGLAAAQQPPKISRVGFLSPSASGLGAFRYESFRKGLHEFGYIEGQNVVFERRSAEGNVDSFPTLAAELVQLKVDVIVALGTPAAMAAKRATSTIPIFIIAVPDPVSTGLVASLARPGGNITGLSSLGVDLSGKRLELLKETVPGLSRVALVWNLEDKGMSLITKQIQAAAPPLGVKVEPFGVRDPNDFDGVFAKISQNRPDAIFIAADRLIASHTKKILEFAIKNKIPAMFNSGESVEAGALMSYGPNRAEVLRRASTLVDKILKGAKPGDLPVEQPMKFELVINLKTAKQIGVTIPPNVLARADRVIK